MVRKVKGGDIAQESTMSGLVDNILSNKPEQDILSGGRKKRIIAPKKRVPRQKKNNNDEDNEFNNKDGGFNIAPFLSALALLGTRIVNDERFTNRKNSLNPFKGMFKSRKTASHSRKGKKSIVSESVGGCGETPASTPSTPSTPSAPGPSEPSVPSVPSVPPAPSAPSAPGPLALGGAKRRTRRTRGGGDTNAATIDRIYGP